VESRSSALGLRIVCALAIAWCALVLVAHAFAGAISCGWDTSYCAQTHTKNGVYRGILRDNQGAAVASTRFTVSFESRRGRPAVEGFATDAHGGYCIVWAQERIVPFANAGDELIPIPDPWESLERAGPPAGCQSGNAGIPWDRADDLSTRAPYRAVQVFALAAVALLAIGLVAGTRRGGRGACAAGLGLAGVSTALTAAQWFL
jgi:hypothetical protein